MWLLVMQSLTPPPLSKSWIHPIPVLPPFFKILDLPVDHWSLKQNLFPLDPPSAYWLWSIERGKDQSVVFVFSFAVPHKKLLVSTICTVVVVVVVAVVAALVLLIILVTKRVRCCSTQPSKSSPMREGGAHDGKYCSTGQTAIRDFSASHYNHPLLISSSSTPSPLPDNETKSLHQFTTLPTPLSHTSLPTISPTSSFHTSPSTPHTSINTTAFTSQASHPLSPESRSSGSSPHSSSTVTTPTAEHPQMLEGSVLVIYSPSINDEDRKLILDHLVGGLMQYGVPTRCHDTACIKSPCQWIEQEIRRASAVLCVCNEDFHREWDERPARGTIPLVGLLKHLVHATVSRGESLAKFATVLLESGHAHYIPSLYLQGDPRLFMVTEVEDIAHFVINVPSYTTPSL